MESSTMYTKRDMPGGKIRSAQRGSRLVFIRRRLERRRWSAVTSRYTTSSVRTWVLNGLGYLCQKAETTWSHVLLMSVLLAKYLTILLLLMYGMAWRPNPEVPCCDYRKQRKLGCRHHPKSSIALQNSREPSVRRTLVLQILLLCFYFGFKYISIWRVFILLRNDETTFLNWFSKSFLWYHINQYHNIKLLHHYRGFLLCPLQLQTHPQMHKTTSV